MSAATVSQTRRHPRSPRWMRIALAAKLLAVTLFLLLTGGPAVEAQVDENNPATFFRLDRQRMQARRPAVRQPRVIQRPTRLIRGARPQRGFSRVVPAAPITVDKPAEPGEAGTAIEPATAAAPAAGPAPNPSASAAVPPPVAGEALRIAVFGDNVGQFLARGLEATYVGRPQITIVRHTRDSSGLVNTRFYDWAEAAAKLIASGEKIDLAVIMLGSNDNQDIVHEGKRLEARSEDWTRQYRQRIEALVAQFRTRKTPLIWVGQPVMRNDRLSAAMLAYNELYREVVTRSGGVYVDVWEAFIDDRNRFSLFGPDLNGRIVKLRTGDGVHFTPAGAQKLAHFADIAIRRQIDTLVKRRAPELIAAPGGAGPAAAGERRGPTGPQQAALPGAGDLTPAVPVEPARPAAGPVVRLMAPDIEPAGELVTSPRAAPAVARELPSAVKRALTSGVPTQARTGRADDFDWPGAPAEK